jgi:peptidoglycan/xylan/chitin deacetylase (PgdA/CDA1 family)
MLLTFLYHRIGEEKFANSKDIIETHLSYLSKKYNIVLPGDKLNLFKLNICLSFDDGFYDFYHYVFPILKKLKIKALLAVPVKFILEKTNIDSKTRLLVPYKDAIQEEVYRTKAPFCTWQELKEMHDSKLVQIASHSYNHISLIENNINLDLEIIESKRILQHKLKTDINTFVYPLGKFNEEIHSKVKQHYKYAMRIGTGINFTWQNINSITYRVLSDNLVTKKQNLKLKRFISYFWFFFLNTFRKR